MSENNKSHLNYLQKNSQHTQHVCHIFKSHYLKVFKIQAEVKNVSMYILR
jgi:hypothetical protein